MAEPIDLVAGLEAAKRAAGRAAAALVEDGMTLGLGTGSTARWFIVAVGELVAAGQRLRGVPTSRASEELARVAGIPCIDLGADGVDLAVDGADQVDPRMRLVKGAGGALVRERIVAAAARRFVVVVDSSKLTARLGGTVPVELVPFGAAATLARIADLGADVQLRRDGSGVVGSDNGNLIADARFGAIDQPETLSRALDALPGVVGHGLFIGLAERVLVARPGGAVEVLGG